MKKFVVRVKQNQAFCDAFDPSEAFERVLSVEYFDSREEAEQAYEEIKNRIKFASLGGEYVTYPTEEEVHVITKKVVCTNCQGHGKVVNPSIEDDGFTMSEMNEMGEDFARSYANGEYDIVCDACNGENVIDEEVIFEP